jgi:hypothetical protein
MMTIDEATTCRGRRSPSSQGDHGVATTALVVIAAVLMTIYGCATHTAATSLGLGPNEALAAGRFQVTYNGDDVTQKIYFQLKNSSGNVLRIDQEESGFFVARLVPGSYELLSIVFSKPFKGAFYYFFEPGRAVIDLPAAGKIYDVGLISIDWTGPGVKMGTYFSLIGALVDVGRGNGAVVIRVSDSADLASELEKRFGTRPEMVIAHLRTGDAQAASATATGTPAPATP